MQIKQSSTAYPLLFQMIDSSDHISGKTGLSPTVTLSKAGAAFASPAGAVTELANGWYKVAGNATDTGTLGQLILHATATGADPVDVVFEVVAVDPQDAVHFGLSALPNVASGSAGAIPTTGSGANQIAVNGSGKISGVVLTDTVTTYTGNTPQTGDNYAIVNNATYGNAKLVRATTPANTLGVDSSGNITVGALAANAITSASINAAALNGKGDWSTATNLTTAQTAITAIKTQTDKMFFTTVAGGQAVVSVVDTLLADSIHDLSFRSDSLPIIGGAVTGTAAFTAVKAKTDQLAFTTTNQVDANVIVKTGFALGATGLDAIPTTAPTGVAATFREMLVALWRRQFKKTTLTATQLKTFAEDGTTVLTTQAVSDDLTTQTQGNAS